MCKTIRVAKLPSDCDDRLKYILYETRMRHILAETNITFEDFCSSKTHPSWHADFTYNGLNWLIKPLDCGRVAFSQISCDVKNVWIETQLMKTCDVEITGFTQRRSMQIGCVETGSVAIQLTAAACSIPIHIHHGLFAIAWASGTFSVLPSIALYTYTAASYLYSTLEQQSAKLVRFSTLAEFYGLRTVANPIVHVESLSPEWVLPLQPEGHPHRAMQLVFEQTHGIKVSTPAPFKPHATINPVGHVS